MGVAGAWSCPVGKARREMQEPRGAGIVTIFPLALHNFHPDIVNPRPTGSALIFLRENFRSKRLVDFSIGFCLASAIMTSRSFREFSARVGITRCCIFYDFLCRGKSRRRRKKRPERTTTKGWKNSEAREGGKKTQNILVFI